VPLERLRIQAVRCLSSVNIELHPKRNFFFGPNGAGKTTVLECVYLLGRGRSFRTRQTARLVKKGATELSVSGDVFYGGGKQNIGVRFQAGQLDIHVGAAKAASIVDLARAFPVHVIDPRIHDLIEAGPSERRRYIDGGVFHVEPEYLGSWRAYRRLLAQRNSALKNRARGNEIEVWSSALAVAGLEIHAARERYVHALAQRVGEVGTRLLNRDIDVEYRPGWRRELDLLSAIRESTERDVLTGFTQVGPHRADISIRMADTGVRDAASRGQQKLVAATLVLAQVQVFAESMGHGGTVLVDDPAAELDADSLQRLLAELHMLDAQLLLTGLSESALAPAPGYPVFHVEQGMIKPML
jgi:DNA replication and repair protein RecF